MGNAVQKRKESIDFSAAAPQGAPVGDDEKLKLEAEILEIDGGPCGPRGSPFKKRRDAAYAERDKAKDVLACLTKDYDERKSLSLECCYRIRQCRSNRKFKN